MPRLKRDLAWYAAIGIATTGGQAVLYLLLREFSAPAIASFGALLVATLVNTEAHRDITFRAAGHVGPWQAHLQAGATSLFVYVVNLALTSEVDALSLGDQPLLEVAVLTAVAAIAGIARFALLRQWVFRPRPPAATPAAHRGDPAQMVAAEDRLAITRP
ncbi:MAG: GtrA family protein [Pseudonocardia sp.]